MTRPAVVIRFDENLDAYRPGTILAGGFWLRGVTADQVKAVETSVLWYTEGKGEEDMAVHAFWRASAEAGDWIAPNRAHHFETTLPQAPLSYSGALLKVRWCVRIRAFLLGGREVIGQRGFQLGSLPAVEPAQP
jgi:hypothetical protein